MASAWSTGDRRPRKIPAPLRATVGGLLYGCVGLTTTGCDTPFQREERVTLTASLPAEKLLIHNRSGEVVIHAEDGVEEIHAKIVKIGKGATLAHGEAALEDIEVSLTSEDGEPGVVVASADHPRGHGWRRYEVKWDIIAPPDLPVEVHSEFGDIEARGLRRGVALRSDFGDLVAEAGGQISLHTKFGEITLHVLPNHPADVTAHTDFGDVTVRLPPDRKGHLAAATDFGDLDIDLQGTTTHLLRHRKRHLEAELGGDLGPKCDLLTEFGDVKVQCHDLTSSEPPAS